MQPDNNRVEVEVRYYGLGVIYSDATPTRSRRLSAVLLVGAIALEFLLTFASTGFRTDK